MKPSSSSRPGMPFGDHPAPLWKVSSLAIGVASWALAAMAALALPAGLAGLAIAVPAGVATLGCALAAVLLGIREISRGPSPFAGFVGLVLGLSMFGLAALAAYLASLV